MVLIERFLLAAADRRAVAQQAQCEERLEKAQLVLVHADRIEGADVECADLHVLHSGAAQRLGGPLAGPRDALGPDVAVVFVFYLQDIRIELLIFAVDLHADLSYGG